MNLVCWTTLGKVADIITIVAFPIAILALVWSYRQLAWMYRQIKDIENTNSIEKERDRLRQAVVGPAFRIRSYADVYGDLINAYSPKLGDGALPINAAYFDGTIGAFFKNQLRFSGHTKDANHFSFPLAGRNEWLLSANQNFTITQRLVNFDRVELTNSTILGAVDKFMQGFQIGSLSTILLTAGKRFWDNPTFDITKFEEKGEKNGRWVELTFQVGSYSNYVRTHEILRHELYYNYVVSNSTGKGHADPTVQAVRRSFEISTFADLFNYVKRPATLGLNIFPIFNKGDGSYCTFLHRRSEDLVENPGFFNVVPSGTFQPLSIFDDSEIARQCSFSYTVLRELMEELYNLEHADKSSASNPFHIFRLEACVGKHGSFVPGRLLIPDKIFNGEKVIPNEISGLMLIKPTAFTVNLVTMKPELAVILLVRDQKVYRQSVEAFQGNWEGSIKEFEIFPDNGKLRSFLESPIGDQ